MLDFSVRKELRARYKGSALGFLWAFLNPLFMLLVYSIVFSYVLRINIPHQSYVAFLFVGLIPWTFFTGSIQQSTNVFITNNNLIKKVYFPREILPLSMVLTNMVNALLSFVIVFGSFVVLGVGFTPAMFWFPVILLIEFILVTALALFISSMTVYLRDLEHIMPILLTALMYLTPVLYPSEYVPERFLWIFRINPMMHIIDAYRNTMLYGKMPGIGLLYAFILGAVMLIGATLLFDRLQKRFAEEI